MKTFQETRRPGHRSFTRFDDILVGGLDSGLPRFGSFDPETVHNSSHWVCVRLPRRKRWVVFDLLARGPTGRVEGSGLDDGTDDWPPTRE